MLLKTIFSPHAVSLILVSFWLYFMLNKYLRGLETPKIFALNGFVSLQESDKLGSIPCLASLAIVNCTICSRA